LTHLATDAVHEPAGPRTSTSAVALEDVRADLGATHASLVAFQSNGQAFRLVASAGLPVFAPGVVLPATASKIAAAAEGRDAGGNGGAALTEGLRPVERVFEQLGLQSGVAIPLWAGGVCVGALGLAWTVAAPPLDHAREVAAERESELVTAVLARSRRRQSVLVAHERRLVGEGTARVIERQVGADVDVASGPDEARQLLTARRFGAVVCSDTFVGELSPSSDHRVDIPVVVLARSDSRRSLALAVGGGASGFVALDLVEDRLGAAVAAVLDGGTAFPSAPPQADGPSLTPREQEVLDGFDLGLSDKEIALKLGVSVSTVKTHARSVYAKLDVDSRTRALHKARVLDLI